MSKVIIKINCQTIGQAWLQTSKFLIEEGQMMKDDDKDIKESINLLILIEKPNPEDETIQRFADPEWLKWMDSNFFKEKDIPELGNAKSYALRLFNYGGQGINQIEKVIEKLKNKPESKSATITTFMPLVDSSYIPCVSLLDFFIRDNMLKLNVYARSLDFGKKAYGNLVALAKIQKQVALALGQPIGEITLFVKSAHIYKEEFNLMETIIKKADELKNK